MTTRARQNEAGFTLLELLVAMTLLGMLSLAMFGGLRLGTQIWRKTDTAATDIRAIRNAQALLRDELSRSYPFFVAGGTDRAHLDFDGTADSITFLAVDKTSGITTRVQFALGHDSETSSLSYLQAPELQSAASAAKRTILTSLKDLEFAYYGPGAPGEEARWQDSWHNRAALPKLVRIRAVLAGRGALPWPELIVAPAIAAEAGCVFDALTKFCQGR